MKTLQFNDREEWLAARRGKITGSRLGDIFSKKGVKKIGYYELIAERLGIPADGETPMDRGTRLEPEALELFSKETGKTVDASLVIWQRDDNESIAISPDGFISASEAVECKCLSSARHIEAWLTQSVPNEYKEQVVQYFIVNDELSTLYFVFYDPRLLAKPFFYLTITRKDVEQQVAEFLEFERVTLSEIDAIVNQLTNF